MSRTGTEAKHSTSARSKRETALPDWRFFLAFLGTVLCCVQALTAQTAQVAKPAVAPNFAKLPLSFTANQGQADKSVNFLAKGQGYGLYLTANEAVLALSKPTPLTSRRNMREIAHLRMLRPFLSPAQRRRLAKLTAGSLGTDTLRMELKGANAQAQVSGTDELPGTTNYFIGNDRTRWRTRVPTFARVHYTGVYPGVDLIYYGNQRRLEYDFVVAPHVNPNQVKLHFSGAQKLKLDHDGKLLVIGDNGEVAFEKPVVYQDEQGQRVPVKGRYALLANHTVGFKVGKYDRSKALVIDPTLSYATYLGGSTEDAGTAIAVDATGNIYIIGFTVDTDFPVTPGAFQKTNTTDNEVAFVAKLNAAGSALVYSTYLGGTSNDTHISGNDAFGIALDGNDSVYVCGETFSNDFPVTPNAYQTQNKGFANDVQNAFISKLSPDGSALVYSTYLGGSGLEITTNGFDFFDGDSPLRMTVDAAGSAYVVGTAYSTDFPTTTGAYQLTNKAAANLASNAFVAKLSPDGTSLAYSTYLGGSGISPTTLNNGDGEGAGEAGYGIAVDAAGEAYVTGYTFSPDFPATGYQQVNHGTANIAANAFVSKLNATGAGLVASTYLGGTGRTIGNGNSDLDATDNGDDGIGVALDAAGDAYVVGVTLSTDFPTSDGAYQTTNKAAANIATNVFVSELNPTLSTLIYSTYVGGSGVASTTAGDRGAGDFGTGIALDTAGDAYITGATESRDFPVSGDAFQAGPRSAQVVDSGFFTELNPGGTALQYSTYVGGSGAGAFGGSEESYFDGDFFYDITLDASNNAYLTGYAYSYDFPVTTNAIQRINNAGGEPGGNSFIAKFGATAGATYLPTTTTLSSTTAGANITFTAVVKPVTGNGVPTGTASFYVNSVKETTVTLDPTGTATYTTNQLEDTLNDVIAAYSGDATYGASGSSLGQTPATPGGTPTQLVFSIPPAAAIGQGGNGGTAAVTVEDALGNIVTTPPVAVTVTITGPAGYTPQTYPVVTTEGGIATLGFGNYPLTIPGIYSYIATSSGLISTVAFETVAPVITGVSPNSVTAGGPAFTLNLTGNFTGFLNNDIYNLCVSSPSSEAGGISFTGSNTAISATIPANYITLAGTAQVYIGNGDCTPQSNSAPFQILNVLPTTTATLAIAPSPVAYGKPVTLTTTVIQNNPTAPVPVTLGQVVFCSLATEICTGQFNLGSAQLNSAGTASLSLYPGAPGVHSYQAVFLGTSTAAAATSPTQSVTVTGTYPTATTLTATGNPGSYTLTGTVVGLGVSTLSPTGSVSIIDQTNSNAVLGTAPLGTENQAQTLVAATGSPLTTGTAPYAVATGDFNGDGFADLAVENYDSGTVSVFLGNGDGTFKPQATYPVGGLPEGIVAADVNGDGKLDLIVSNTDDDTVSVLLGNGDGTFQAQVTYPTDDGPAGIIVADFNHDGKLDIATSNYYAGDVSILLGNGDGTFQEEVTYAVGTNNPQTTNPRTLASGDFNADGNIDLAVANQGENTVSILFGNGDGTFQAQLLYPVGISPQGLAVADFNGDGNADLAIGNNGNSDITGNVGIMLGTGGGGFGSMTVYAAGKGPLNPVVADFNGDGVPDIAVENFTDNTESLLLGNGDGTFQPQTVFPTGTSPYAAAIGDFNGDGNPDLAISNFGSNNETVLLDQLTSTTTAVLTPLSVPGTGTHNVAASYPGDTNFSTSISTAIPLMGTPQLPATTITLTANPTFSFVGQPVTLTATLAPYNGTNFTTDGETVTFLNGGTAIGTGTLASGVATFTTAALPVGAISLTASYPGDANLAASVSAPLSYDVTPAATTATTLAVTSGGTAVTTVPSGTAVTLTATVTIATGAPVTPGLVTFCDATAPVCENSAILGTGQLTAAGTAALKFVPGIGSHSYKAIFAGTAANATSTSAAQPLTVTGTGTYPTATTIAASGTPGNYTLTGTVVGTRSAYAQTSVFVIPNQPWIDTGISVTAGQSLTITATGETDWYTGGCPAGQSCTNGPNGSNPPNPCTGVGVIAPNLVCYSLIGRIGTNGTPFQVGASLNIASLPATGELYLSVNDGYFADNTLGWTAFVNVGPTPTGKVNFLDTTNGNTSLGMAALGTATLGLSFVNSANPAVGNDPNAVATGDFNGDGIPDLAVANYGDGKNPSTVTVLLGHGDGTFTATAVSPAVGIDPTYIAVGDFNGDGKADLVVSNSGVEVAGVWPNGTVTVLLGNGDGTFTPAASPTTGKQAQSIAVGDFNGDGKLDMAIVNGQSDTLTILLGNGDGTFTAAASPAAGNGPYGIATGDFNGDGKLDLATPDFGSNSVMVLLGNGDGTFTAAPSPATGTQPNRVVIADFNGDGKADMAVTNGGSNTLTILLGNGDGTFTPAASPATGAGPYGIVASDFNGDGNADLAVTNAGDGTIKLLLGNGDGTFTALAASPGVGYTSITAGDFNGDGVPDLAATNNTGNTMTVLLTQRTQTAIATLSNVSVTGAPGNHNVVASYPGDTNFTGSTSTPVTLVPVAISTPAIASLTPNAAYVGSGATTVTINGTDFLTGAAVTVNGTSQAATFVSATQLTTTLTVAQLSTVGTLTLVVVNPDGGTSNTAAFAVLPLPLQLTPANLAFGNQTVGTTSAPQGVTVANTTDAAITITTIILDLGLNPGDFAQTNNCPATLEAGASCQITVTFAPHGVGPKSAGLLVSDNTSLPNESVNMTGTGTGGILQVNPGNLKTIAGNGTAGYSGDGGSATAAELNDPDGVAFDAQGNMYIADVLNSVIRKVDTSGNISTVAGNGTAGFSGDGGPATAAELKGPFGVTPDSAGNLYIQDTLNARIRKVDPTGTITTIAGNGTPGYSGDGGPATAAELSLNQGARFDASGNLFVADCGNGAVRKIDTAGIITTVAGNGTDGFSGDGGPATSAQLSCPSGVAIDTAGDLFIADYLNNRIRKVDAATGIITTIAGNGTPGFTGDGGPALSAEINLPNDVELDDAGDIYIADSGNNRLREINTTGVISTVVGGLNNAGSAGINAPSALAMDKAGNLYFSDAGNNAVREVFPAGALAFPTTPIGVAAANETVTLANIGNLPVTIASQASFGLSGNTTDFSLVGGTCLAGATLAPNGGTCTLQIGFTPTATGTRTLTVSITDDAVYSPQSFSISGVGTAALPVVLNSITPAGAQAGAANTTITAAGANFTATSVVNFNATPLATTFVSATQLTAVIPAALITTAGTANITITDAFSGSTSAPEVFTILPGTPAVVTFTAPPTNPGEQSTLNFSLTQPYPVAITGTMTLTFAPDTGNPDNPEIQLVSTTTGVTVAPGGRSLTFPLPANSTATPVVMVQVGNVSGTITITLELTAAGVNVTPANVTPISIVVPRVAPTISTVSFSASGNTLTVLVTGFSTTREIQSATFTFTPASGASLNQKTITVPANTLFQSWYTTTGSDQFGSAFTYTQLFTLSGNASAVGGVGATLTNSVGTSTEVTAP